MLKALFDTLAVLAQQAGLIILVVGCFFLTAGILTGRMAHLIKGTGLLLVGGYLAGLASIPH